MKDGIRPTICLGEPAGAHVLVEWLARAHPGGLGELHGWVLADVRVAARARRWRYDAFLRPEEFARFAAELAALRAGASARAALAPRDPWVAMTLVDEQGLAGCAARVFAHEFDSERQVEFACTLAPADLERLERELAAALRLLPPLAAPGS